MTSQSRRPAPLRRADEGCWLAWGTSDATWAGTGAQGGHSRILRTSTADARPIPHHVSQGFLFMGEATSCVELSANLVPLHVTRIPGIHGCSSGGEGRGSRGLSTPWGSFVGWSCLPRNSSLCSTIDESRWRPHKASLDLGVRWRGGGRVRGRRLRTGADVAERALLLMFMIIINQNEDASVCFFRLYR